MMESIKATVTKDIQPQDYGEKDKNEKKGHEHNIFHSNEWKQQLKKH